jgi:hypothetical protein
MGSNRMDWQMVRRVRRHGGLNDLQRCPLDAGERLAGSVAQDPFRRQEGASLEQPALGTLDEFVQAGHVVGLQAELLLQGRGFVAVEVAQAQSLARPALVVVQRFAAPVDRAQARDAGTRHTELLGQVVEQGLRNIGQPIQRPAAGAQEHELHGDAKSPVRPEALFDLLCIVGQQAEEPGDIELGQGPGKPLSADETQLVAGHGGFLRFWLRARVGSDKAPEFCASLQRRETKAPQNA